MKTPHWLGVDFFPWQWQYGTTAPGSVGVHGPSKNLIVGKIGSETIQAGARPAGRTDASRTKSTRR